MLTDIFRVQILFRLVSFRGTKQNKIQKLMKQADLCMNRLSIVMGRRFRNFCNILSRHVCTVQTTEEEFHESRKIKFVCPQGHVSELDEYSFVNKTSPKKMATLKSICGKCNTHLTVLDKVSRKATTLGMTILLLEEDNLHLTYRCRCGAVHRSDTKSICKSSRTSTCPTCQNDANKVDYGTMKKAFDDAGCTLLTSKEDYKNNKQLLDYVCECGTISKIVYFDIRRGRRCRGCRVMRAKQTSLEAYGVDNPSKCDTIKDKIIKQNLAKYGVQYAMQCPDIFRRAQQSSFSRRIYTSPFGQTYNI